MTQEKTTEEKFEPVIPMRKSNLDRILKEAREQTKQKIIDIIEDKAEPPLGILYKDEILKSIEEI